MYDPTALYNSIDATINTAKDIKDHLEKRLKEIKDTKKSLIKEEPKVSEDCLGTS